MIKRMRSHHRVGGPTANLCCKEPADVVQLSDVDASWMSLFRGFVDMSNQDYRKNSLLANSGTLTAMFNRVYCPY